MGGGLSYERDTHVQLRQGLGGHDTGLAILGRPNILRTLVYLVIYDSG